MKTTVTLQTFLAIMFVVPCSLQCMGEKYTVETSRKEQENPTTVIEMRQSPDLESRVSVLSSTVTEPSLTRTAGLSPTEPSRALEAESKESVTRATSPTEPSEMRPAPFLRADRSYPFHVAAALGGTESEQLLLQAVRSGECNPNERDNHRRTLLHYAAANGHEKIVRLLITKRGQNRFVSDTSPLDDTNQTPLSYADEFHHAAIIKTYLQQDHDRTMLSHEIDVLATANNMNRNDLIAAYSAYVSQNRLEDEANNYISDEIKTTNQEVARIVTTQIPLIPTHTAVVATQQNEQEHKDPVVVNINLPQVNVIVDDQLPQAAHNNFLTNQPRAHRHRSPSTACCCTRWYGLAACAMLTLAAMGITFGISISKGMM